MTGIEAMENSYDVLVTEGGAREERREDFLYHHRQYGTKEWLTHTEWRFMGKFGFGGKFRTDSHYGLYMNYYPENHTPELDALEKVVIEKLQAIWKEYSTEHPAR